MELEGCSCCVSLILHKAYARISINTLVYFAISRLLFALGLRPMQVYAVSCRCCPKQLYGPVNFCPFCGSKVESAESVCKPQNSRILLDSMPASPSLSSDLSPPIPKDSSPAEGDVGRQSMLAGEKDEPVHTVRPAAGTWKWVLATAAILVVVFLGYLVFISKNNEEQKSLTAQQESLKQGQVKLEAERTRIELEKIAAQDKKRLAEQQEKLRQDQLKLDAERQRIERDKVSEEQDRIKLQQARIDDERQRLEKEKKEADERAKVAANNQGSTIPSIPSPQPSLNSGGLFNTNYRSQATSYIESMVVNAPDKDKTMSAMSSIESLRKPSKGDKSRARKLNDQALILIRQSKDRDAIPLLIEARKADPSDVEVVNNLAGAFFNTSFDTHDFSKAKELLVDTLLLKPNRSIAWANLGRLFAMEGNELAATNCFINYYRFAGNQQRALQHLTNGLSDPHPVLCKAFTMANQYVSANMPAP